MLETDIKSMLPSLTFLIKNRPEMLEVFAKDLFHFSNKMINSLNSSTPICIKSNNPQKHLPYISLNTIGVFPHELDYNANAANSAPIKLIKAFYKGKDIFIQKLNEIIEDKQKANEKLKPLLESEDPKERDKSKKDFDKNEKIIDYCNQDKKNYELIDEKIGIQSKFYKDLFEKEIPKEIPAFSRQVLMYDEDINDYISISPVYSMIMNKKFEEAIEEITKENTDYKYKKASGDIGGSKAQNVTTYNKSASFRLFMPTTKIKDKKYKKLWRLIFKGFYLRITKEEFIEICSTLKKYKIKKTLLHKRLFENSLRKVLMENIKMANNINFFIEDAIKEKLLEENEKNGLDISDININSKYFLNEYSNNKLVKELYNGLMVSFTESAKHAWLFRNRADKIDVLTQDFLNKINSKLLMQNISVDSEIENIIKKIIIKELEQ